MKASVVPKPMPLRQISDDRWQVQHKVGSGRTLDFGAENMRLEVFQPPWSSSRAQENNRAALRTTYDTAVRCRYGVLLTDGSAALWCLLGGVPLPATTASPEEAALRLSIALARAPEKLVRIIGALALEDGAAALAADLDGTVGDDAVEMMLRLSRDDVTVYARANASAALWLRLLPAMSGEPQKLVDQSPPAFDDDNAAVSLSVAIGSGRVSSGLLRALGVGDVVRLPTSFDIKGIGRLRMGRFDVGVRWLARSPHHEFEVLTVSPLRYATSSSSSSTGTDRVNMNPNHPDPLDEERAANGLSEDAEPDLQPGWEDTLDEADQGHEAGEAKPTATAKQAGGVNASLDGMAITLVAEIGVLTMTLGHLKSMKPGMLIKLGARGTDEVVLKAADGPALAYAELVDIGGHLGMQITRLANS